MNFEITNELKKNKSHDSLIAEYMDKITANCEQKMPTNKKQIKVQDGLIDIPTVKTYHHLLSHNYSVNQLKIFAKNYKLKISGNKPLLVSRIYSYLYFSSYIMQIQKVCRGFLARKYKLLHGPAAILRKICNNATDFITMEPIEEINFHQFISYKDVDGFIYGFDITSLHNLFSKGEKAMTNPYNRTAFPSDLIKNIKSLIRLGRILSIQINLKFEDDMKNISSEKAVQLRALAIFQAIDALGNYSDPKWFLSLTKPELINFVKELMDIYNYRAQLTDQVKRAICPPNGSPFNSLSISHLVNETNINVARNSILNILDKFVNSGIDNDSKSLGAIYVLGALTMVNQTAATSLPWLFQSMNYF